ncbi:2Fe-2S iron-sulfur cluster-binding protein [Emcibacter sp.]|uniref:2Fe-2S iron-sulfur cluster-binding protein n=1 Tax=Emcibacter sp. TaxID=1979954 RepID=UPI002AA8C4CC|nr:2Fe-2S iron-sulfur cluster-binding protein [Emcibacter sp.]
MERIWTISLDDSSESFRCRGNEAILAAAERQGRREIEIGCRRGGCGFCRIKVLSGSYRLGPMSRSKVSREEETSGIVLACRLYPESDLRIRTANF